MNELRDVGSLPEAVVKDYQRLLASNPARRLNPAKVLETNEYFQNKLLDTCTFLESLALKDSAEKVRLRFLMGPCDCCALYIIAKYCAI